jgi:DNA-binding GntR family transcriptional regulator
MMSDASVRRSAAIQTDQLSNRTYETLRDRILQGDLSSGQRLAVRELAESLGVSVTPVRDAVNRLAADGLVEVSPRRGTVVASFTPRDVRELYDLRVMLEPAAAEVAALRLSEEELGDLRQLATRLHPFDDIASPDAASFLREGRIHHEFHRAIVRGARNRRLDALFEEIQANLGVMRAMVYPRLFLRREQQRRVHIEIVEALEGRDPALARARLAAHLEKSRDDLLAHMLEGDGAASMSGAAAAGG